MYNSAIFFCSSAAGAHGRIISPASSSINRRRLENLRRRVLPNKGKNSPSAKSYLGPAGLAAINPAILSRFFSTKFSASETLLPAGRNTSSTPPYPTRQAIYFLRDAEMIFTAISITTKQKGLLLTPFEVLQQPFRFRRSELIRVLRQPSSG